MTTIKAFIKRHPVATYFALAFAISWGGILFVVGPGGFPATPEQAEALLPYGVLMMLAGPSVAGVVLTGLVSGRAGYRELLSGLLRWRVGARWYAVALLTAPILATTTIFALSLLSPGFLPGVLTADGKAALLLVGVAYGLAAGFFEELGWTGFAISRMRQRYGILATGLVVGLLWGAWHWLSNFWGSGTSSGDLALSLFLAAQLFSVAVLPAYRVLMVWVYDRTGGSLLVAMLMHASLTAVWLILMPPGVSALLIWYLVLAATLWVVVAAVAAANGWHFSRQPPLRRRVA
jgi:membrane protease YdiL (CAAX protease family)